MKIKKGDQVQIIAGKDRGKRGAVNRVIPKKEAVVIDGLNLVKKHTRPKREGERGQRVEVPAATNVSNVMLICRHCGNPTRVGYKVAGEKKLRVCKKCSKEI